MNANERIIEAVNESEERYRRLVELSPDGITITFERRFVFMNPAGIRILGDHAWGAFWKGPCSISSIPTITGLWLSVCGAWNSRERAFPGSN